MSHVDEPADLPCNEFVEWITDYLDGALSPEAVARVDAHLVVCSGCREALEQWRQVIRTAGRLGASQVASVDPAVRAALLDAFRNEHPRAS